MSQALNTHVSPASVLPELSGRIDLAMRNSQQSGKPFAVVVLQIGNLAAFRKRNSELIVRNLVQEIYTVIRKAVHESQYVGKFHEGLAMVFDGMDVGSVDTVSKRLLTLTQHIIRSGRYNDLTSRWTDIIYQFLFPNSPLPLFPKCGWAIFPRDGMAPKDLLIRAVRHAGELMEQQS